MLGRGGMGAVYRARDPSGREVALKVMLPGADPDGRLLRRFQSEVEAVARVGTGPNVVRIHRAGEHRGMPFAVYDLIEGRDLAARLKAEGPLPLDEALRLTEEVARTVAHCHRQGVLHRDLKPANILLRDDGVPFLTDFGLALETTSEERLTKTGEVLGTPAYMAPEQAEGDKEAMGTRTDVYALGAILYALTTGRPPFEGDALHVLRKVLLNPPPPVQQHVPGLPAALDAVCRKAMAKDPASRYPTAEAFANDVARLRRGEPIRARPPGRWERLRWRWRRDRKRIVAQGALLLALLTLPPAGYALYRFWATPAFARVLSSEAFARQALAPLLFPPEGHARDPRAPSGAAAAPSPDGARDLLLDGFDVATEDAAQPPGEQKARAPAAAERALTPELLRNALWGVEAARNPRSAKAAAACAASPGATGVRDVLRELPDAERAEKAGGLARLVWQAALPRGFARGLLDAEVPSGLAEDEEYLVRHLAALHWGEPVPDDPRGSAADDAGPSLRAPEAAEAALRAWSPRSGSLAAKAREVALGELDALRARRTQAEAEVAKQCLLRCGFPGGGERSRDGNDAKRSIDSLWQTARREAKRQLPSLGWLCMRSFAKARLPAAARALEAIRGGLPAVDQRDFWRRRDPYDAVNTAAVALIELCRPPRGPACPPAFAKACDRLLEALFVRAFAGKAPTDYDYEEGFGHLLAFLSGLWPNLQPFLSSEAAERWRLRDLEAALLQGAILLPQKRALLRLQGGARDLEALDAEIVDVFVTVLALKRMPINPSMDPIAQEFSRPGGPLARYVERKPSGDAYLVWALFEAMVYGERDETDSEALVSMARHLALALGDVLSAEERRALGLGDFPPWPASFRPLTPYWRGKALYELLSKVCQRSFPGDRLARFRTVARICRERLWPLLREGSTHYAPRDLARMAGHLLDAYLLLRERGAPDDELRALRKTVEDCLRRAEELSDALYARAAVRPGEDRKLHQVTYADDPLWVDALRVYVARRQAGWEAALASDYGLDAFEGLPAKPLSSLPLLRARKVLREHQRPYNLVLGKSLVQALLREERFAEAIEEAETLIEAAERTARGALPKERQSRLYQARLARAFLAQALLGAGKRERARELLREAERNGDVRRLAPWAPVVEALRADPPPPR
ncbi:MAG: serine/threonine protein kinase [Planctomycetota bacterium]|nr:MAG: serine/threonine protein kinase [Planctomycetota bacterium]